MAKLLILALVLPRPNYPELKISFFVRNKLRAQTPNK